MKWKIYSLICFLLLGTSISIAQKSKEELERDANRHFANEEFLEATPLYLRLLSLEPRNHNYNYRYGTCLLFNSKKKESAFKYLQFAVQGENVELEAFYYLGRAYHLTYQFKLAITNYKKYKEKAGSRAVARLDVDRQIEMCRNGLSLLSTINEKVVLSKREMVESDFFRIYDLSNIGGQIIVTEAFQNRQDVRNGHTPVIHFPADSDKIFYSSYGERDDNKDIYMRQRLPDGSWSKEQKVMGSVNTKYDEDFPYMHPNGRHLYFCSKGHNSMGGYDVFRADYDAESNKFFNVENMDFPISSPDDDLLYVVDSLDRLAFFSSKRESEFGKVMVYNVRVERFPIQLAVIKGTFNSTIDPSVKEMTIQVTDNRSGKRIGTFETNRKGEYLITLPKGGAYEFVISVDDKENTYKHIIDVPLLKEFRPLKQRIEETTRDNNEVVLVYNLFDEAFDDPSAIMAEIIEAQSKMEVNRDNFDLDSLDIAREQTKVLAELGLENFSPIELIQMTDEKVNDIELRISNSEEQLTKSLLKIEKSKRIKQDAIRRADSLMQLALNEPDSEKKEQFMRRSNQALATANEQDRLIENAEIVADFMRADIEKMKPVLEKAKAFQAEIHAVDRNDIDAIVAVIAKNKQYASEHLKHKTRVDARFELIEQIDAKIRAAGKLREKERQLQADEERLLAEIEQLEKDIPGAKRRQREDMERELRQKQAQLEDVQSEQRFVANKLKESENYTEQRDAVNAIENINVAEEETYIAQNPLSKSDEEAKDRLKKLNEESKKINTELGIDPEGDAPQTTTEEPYIVADDTPAIQALNETEKRYASGEANTQEYIAAIEDRIAELQNEREQLEAKVANQSATTNEKRRIAAIEKEVNEQEKTIARLTQNEAILTTHADDFEHINNTTAASMERLSIATDLRDKLTAERAALDENDGDYTAKKAAYDQQIETIETLIDTLESETAEATVALTADEKTEILANTSTQEKQAIINDIDGDYAAEIAKLQEQLQQGQVSAAEVNERQQAYINDLETEAAQLTQKIKNGENVAENKQRLAVVQEEIEREKAIQRDAVEVAPTEALTQAEKTEILAVTSTQEKQAIINDIDADYAAEITELQEQLQQGQVSAAEVNERQQAYINKLEKEATQLTQKIKNGENVAENKQRLAVVQEEIEREKAIQRDAVEAAPTEALTQSEKTEILAATSTEEKQAIINDIDADYAAEIAELQEQLQQGRVSSNAVNARQQAYINDLEIEAAQLTQKIKNAENVAENKQRLAVVQEEIEREKAIQRDAVEAAPTEALTQAEKTEILAAISTQEKQAIINDIDGDYTAEIAELQEQLQEGQVSAAEVNERQQAYISKLEQEAAQLEEKILNGENVTENKQRLAVLEEEISKEKAIQRDAVSPTATAEAPSVAQIIADIDPKYEEEIAELNNANAPLAEKQARKEAFLEKLNKEIAKAEKKLAKSPEDEAAQALLSTLREIANELENELAEMAQIASAELAEKVNNLSDDEKDAILDKVARKVRIEIGELTTESKVNPDKLPELLAAKKTYLASLKTEQERLKEKINKGKASEEERIEAALLAQEIDATELAISELEKALFVDISAFPDLADEALSEQANLNQDERNALSSGQTDLFTLKNRLLALDKLEKELLALKAATTASEKERAIDQKIKEVQGQKRKATIAIGELEQGQQDVVAAVESSNASASEKERTELSQRVNTIQEIDEEINELRNAAEEETNPRRQDRMNKQIEKLENQKANEKAALLSQTADINKRTLADYSEELTVDNDASLNSVSANKSMNNAEVLLKEAEKTKNPQEKQRLLAAANREQQNAIAEAKEAQRKRQFQILIGDLSSDLELNNIDERNVKTTTADIRNEQIEIGVKLREIDDRLKTIESNLSQAKRKEAEELEKLKDAYLTLKTNLEQQQFNNELALEAIEKERKQQREKGVAEDAKTKPVTYEEEVNFAQTDTYKELFTVTNKLSQKQYELKVKEELIEQKQKDLSIVTQKIENADAPNDNEIEEVANILKDIDRLKEESRRIKIEIGDLQQEMKERLPADERERVIAENLVSREVDPIQKMPTLPVMTTGLILNDPNRRPYSDDNPIPLEVEKPRGLVFRVQIGAFSRPVPNETFNEFSPVTGEEVRPGLIRYVAGFFGSRGDATTARDQIRGLGYSDAFVVAYCDGERIPVYRAEELMASGACVPTISTPENVIVTAEEAEAEGRLTTGASFEEELDAFAYNKAPGAAEAEAAEARLGLYFTVQVGVYNKPVSAEQLKNISPLVTKRLPNGQIRYSSGMFDNEQAAGVQRAEAIERGISDAFIVAYYKGERLMVGQARKLLEEHGEEILESRNPTIVRRSSVSSPIAQPQEPDPEPYLKWRELQVQWESKEVYNDYPTQVLNRYNETEGLFFYDWKTGKIKSFIYPSSTLPNIAAIANELNATPLYKNQRVLDTDAILVENALNTMNTRVKSLVVKVRFEDLSDEFVNYMLKLNASKSLTLTESGIIVEVYEEYEGRKIDLNAVKIDFVRFSASEFEYKTYKLERND